MNKEIHITEVMKKAIELMKEHKEKQQQLQVHNELEKEVDIVMDNKN